jgi:glycine cleavage system H protein
MPYPADFRYTKEHEWIKADGATATIGITSYAQESLGDIVFVDLPKVGSDITVGKTFGSVESVKAVSDLYAPASGTVTEVNAERRPEIIALPCRLREIRFRRRRALKSSVSS